MLLADTESKEQVEAAIEAGDWELEEDIQDRLEEAKAQWEAEEGWQLTQEPDVDLRDEMSDIAFAREVQRDSPGEWDLEPVPEHMVRAAALHSAHVFVVSTSIEGAQFHYQIHPLVGVEFDLALLPDGAENIPSDIAEDFWEDLGGGEVEWSQTENVGWNTGNVEPEAAHFIVSDQDEFFEFCRDVMGQYVEALIESDPGGAVSLMLSHMSVKTNRLVNESDVDVLNDEDIQDFVHAFMMGDEEQREETEEDLVNHLTAFEDTGPPEVILEVTRDDLSRIGVRKGTFWENAPWTLYKLGPPHLREEGRRMRHCVGDSGMGYIRALADGDVEIWSLRNKAGKPRFTLEVDADMFHHPEHYVHDAKGLDAAQLEDLCTDRRAEAIKQLKGKGNRTPGYAQAHDSDVRFEDEVKLWMWLLDEVLKVDAESVVDFPALRVLLQRQKEAFAQRDQRAFDMADRGELMENPGRSFDLPYRPL